jgi:hypothetical protein
MGNVAERYSLTDALAGTRTGSFDTTRWLATASLTGNYFRGPWRWSPQGSLAYGSEKYDSFTNSLGQQVNGSDISGIMEQEHQTGSCP